MEDSVKTRDAFVYVLCSDVERLERFRGTSAEYVAEFRRHGKALILTSTFEPKQLGLSGADSHT